jgi:hypothetical protein
MEIINMGLTPEEVQRFEDSVFDPDDAPRAPASKVVALTRPEVTEMSAGMRNMLDVLNTLRENILSGQVVAYAAVSIAPDDVTALYSGARENVSRLRMMGAISNLNISYLATSSDA